MTYKVTIASVILGEKRGRHHPLASRSGAAGCGLDPVADTAVSDGMMAPSAICSNLSAPSITLSLHEVFTTTNAGHTGAFP